MGEPALKLVSTRGPAPAKTAGTFQDEIKADEPKMPPAVRRDKVMRDLWRTIVPPLVDAGMVSAADAPAIEMALRHYRAAIQASDELNASGATVSGREDTIVKNPADVVFRGESAMFLQYATQVGLTFAARARTRVPKETDDDGESNPYA